VNGAVLLAAPGGNPAPLAALVWALHEQGVRVERLELVLYRSAHDYLVAEFLAEGGPYSQLCEALGEGVVGPVVPTVVRDRLGQPLEDDTHVDHHLVFAGTVWDLARRLTRGSRPVIFALVGGRRRTLTVDMVTTFQLLARPEDRLVDLRLTPKYADDPGTGFAFPAQKSPCVVPAGYGQAPTVPASDVKVDVIDLVVPRLGQALREEDRSTFQTALAAGERAVHVGGAPRLQVDVLGSRVHFGDTTMRLSRSEMVWFLALVLARLGSPEGWVDADEAGFLEQSFEQCLAVWTAEPDDLSDGFDFRPEAAASRPAWLGPLRSKTRKRLLAALRGHPHRDLVVPQKIKGKARKERILLDAEHIEIIGGP
jgi:CRISPR-associated protein (TIGR02584 family)